MTARLRNRARRAAAALPIAILLAAGPVTVVAQEFPAILAAPDDSVLNLSYAREQARLGNLSAAASTLERILIAEPNRHSVRLFYAVVLYRLGDLQSAREQLKRLEGVDLPPLQRAEADRYARRIDQGLATSSFSGRLGVGVVYEDDAAGAYFTAFDLIGAPPAEEGVSSEAILTLDGRTSLGASRVLDIYGSGLLYDRSSLSGAAVDFQRADLEVGLSRTTRLTTSKLGLAARHVRLLGDPQLTEVGLRIESRWRVTNATTLIGHAEAVSQDFDEDVVDGLAPIIGGDRDGERYAVGVGLSHRLTSRTTVALGVDYETKNADYEPFGYAGPRVHGSLEQRFDRGVYALVSASVRQLDYDAPDLFFLGGATREDTRTWARFAVGAPLSAFTAGGATGDVRENLTLEGAFSYGSRESSAPLADYDGWGGEIRLVWRFGARN